MLGIVIILNVFFNVIVSLAYPSPEYNDYCPNIQTTVAPADASACDAQGGIWTNYPSVKETQFGTAATPTGYCDMYAKCQKPFETAMDERALYAFVIMIGLGIVALVAGLLPIGSSIVSSGLSYGGVLAFIIASMEYWGSAGNWIRLAIATAGLVALLYIGWRRFRD